MEAAPLPTAARATPAPAPGSLNDHAGMHVAAVLHEYETDVRLPPPTDAGR